MMEIRFGKLSEGGGRDRWRNYLFFGENIGFLDFLNPKVKHLSPFEAYKVLNAVMVEQPLRADWMKTATMWHFSCKEASTLSFHPFFSAESKEASK